MRIHIVTDSGALFAHPQLVSQYPLSIVPNTIEIAGTRYKEGVDLTPEQALEMLSHQVTPPKIIAPSVDDYVAMYTHLAHTNDAIISIHTSRDLTKSWENARTAAQQLEGHVKIGLVDSRALDAAHGMIVRAAVRAIEEIDDIDELVRVVRGATERVYSVYYVERTDYLMRNNIMPPSHAILTAMNRMIPLITIEDGMLVAMEKVKNRAQAVDRLIEFVIEFVEIEDALILQPRNYMSEQTRLLQDRLAMEFPGKHFPHAVYGPSLASFIGAGATGLVILERNWDELEGEP